MAYLRGESRYQTNFSITCLDDFINENNSVRAIDAFVNVLDLKENGFEIYQPKSQGQCPYDRKDLLKLHIYGYMNGIRSSRKLETESKRNIDVMWLINKLTPDHGTISSFVKDNKDAFRSILKKFSLLLKGWGLIDGKLIAIDGTKLRANNSKKNYLTLESIDKRIEYIEKQIDEYMKELEYSSNETINKSITKDINVEEIKEKIQIYEQRKEDYKNAQKDMKAKGLKQVSITDPDSRGMKNNGKGEVCYNVQTAVDSKNCLIADCEVVNDINDLNQLSNMSTNAKKALNKRKLTVVADTGYYNTQEIKKCIDKKIKVYIKKPKANNQTGDDAYRKDKFTYIPEDDKYICPEGMELPFSEYTTKNAVKYKRYKGTQCQNCSKKSLCTQAKDGRNIQRLPDEDIIEKVIADTKNNTNIYKKRRCIVDNVIKLRKQNDKETTEKTARLRNNSLPVFSFYF
ncbi:MAG: hypothetical protein QG641_782 [Candidatus Poribacteria bacterium]|nr:hypothetical protein [Candidatus Poribacteria bacterium]